MAESEHGPEQQPDGPETGAAPTSPATPTTPAVPAVPAASTRGKRGGKRGQTVLGAPRWVATLFLLPALILLGALVVYPIGYSIWRSMMDADGSAFVGLDNYQDMFTTHSTLTAIKNNAIWVVVAPVLSTALGLMFAVLTERVRWGTAFKLIVFMPMAISMLAAGIIFRMVYDEDPDKGVINAVAVAVDDTFSAEARIPRAKLRPTVGEPVKGGGFISEKTYKPGDPAVLPMLAVPQEYLPSDPARAAGPKSGPGLNGSVWFDFTKGGGGTPEKADAKESGLKGLTVQAVKGGAVVATAKTAADGTFNFPADKVSSGVRLRLPESNFAEPFNGVTWLSGGLITPAIIASYIWMWAGFAMVLISAGLAGIPRELLEAARVDGANEWQVFRRITVPVLMPVLVVVTVTLMINVLKIFDLIWIIAPGTSQPDATVLALELVRESFGGSGTNQGIGSAIGVFLLLLVIPVMWFNIRRFRKEREH